MASQRERYKAALAEATKVFENEDRAQKWMREPAFGLNGQNPGKLVATAEGADLVHTYLGQIEYCVFV